VERKVPPSPPPLVATQFHYAAAIERMAIETLKVLKKPKES
jgi:hypothetical protein